MGKFKVIIPCFIFLVVVFFYFYNGNQKTENAVREQEIAKIKALDHTLAKEKQEFLKKEEALKKLKGRDLTTNEFLSLLPEKARAYYKFALKGNVHEIAFYGKVVDQYGEPVSDVQIYLETGGSFVSGGGRLRRISDEQGSFNVNTEGSAIFVTRLIHSNISHKLPLNKRGKPIALDFGFADDNYQWENYSSPETPFIIKVWRLEKLERVIAGKRRVVMEPDERVYTINFIPKRDREKGYESKAQLRVKAYADEYSSDIHYVDAKVNWWFEIEAIKGGLQEAPDDPYLNLVPEEGYENIIRVGAFANGREGPQDLRNKRYYFRSNNGREHGSLIINFNGVSGRKDRKPVLIMRYKINPDGSRNLAVKPKQN
jgi:hypothetical protein